MLSHGNWDTFFRFRFRTQIGRQTLSNRPMHDFVPIARTEPPPRPTSTSFFVMPGLVPLLSGLDFQAGLCADGRERCRAGRAFSGHPLPPAVMPGLVPGIHTPPPPRPRPARTAMPHGVDARNKSGHDAVGEGGARPRTATGDAGAPKFVSRADRSAGNPLALKPFAPPERIKPDSNGLVPGIHVPPPPRPLPARTAMPQTWMPGTSPGMTVEGTATGETPARRNSCPEPPGPDLVPAVDAGIG